MRKVQRGEPLNISANDWNAIADTVNGSPTRASGRDIAIGNSPLGSQWLWIKNTSGSDRARWDSMSLGAAVFTIGANGQEDLAFSASTINTTDVPVILLEPIANGRFGRAVVSGFCLAKLATAPSSGLSYAIPNAAGNNLLPTGSGPIRLLAAGSTSEATVRPVLLGSAVDLGADIFLTPSGGIAARTGSSSPWTPGVATCTLCEYYVDAGTVKIRMTEITEPIYNMVPAAIGEYKLIQAKRIGGRRTIDVEPC